jgi:hypothetical protein
MSETVQGISQARVGQVGSVVAQITSQAHSAKSGKLVLLSHTKLRVQRESGKLALLSRACKVGMSRHYQVGARRASWCFCSAIPFCSFIPFVGAALVGE